MSALESSIFKVEIFPWNDNFDTGIAIIDEQHKKLVTLLNDLATHFVHQSDSMTMAHVFDKLADYAIYHFQTEEKIWATHLSQDPLEKEHLATHRRFVDDILHLKRKITDKNSESGVIEVVTFLTNWLAFHILDTDKHMAKIVLYLDAGHAFHEAKELANQNMSGSMEVLIETLLSMYEKLSINTLKLGKEIIARQKAEAELKLVSSAMQYCHEPICITDAEFNIVNANPAFLKSTQSTNHEVMGAALIHFKPGLKNKHFIAEVLHGEDHWNGTILSETIDGEKVNEQVSLSAIRDEFESITNYISTFSDVTHLFQKQDELEHLVNHDGLTALPNKALLSDRLEIAIARAKRNNTSIAVCFMDLDGFKQVNDTLGHATGDFLLIEIAKRLQHIARTSDTVARIGGDEFVIIFDELEKTDHCTPLLDRIIHEISQPFIFQEAESLVGASIGVSFYPDHNTHPEELIKLADQAMYEAKRQGKSRYHFA